MQLIGLFLLLIPVVLFNFALEERGRKMIKQIEEQESLGAEVEAGRWVENADRDEKWTSAELALGMMISLGGFGLYLFYAMLS
ncbi:hypothetical protein ACFFIY_03300 [Bhargavaea ullalensis]|uniref:Uncharacterized protein n=1 Tax=Bhargavaea ullalensis TaxID=1265685 RepID=A0ABV2GE05_9BACL